MQHPHEDINSVFSSGLSQQVVYGEVAASTANSSTVNREHKLLRQNAIKAIQKPSTNSHLYKLFIPAMHNNRSIFGRLEPIGTIPELQESFPVGHTHVWPGCEVELGHSTSLGLQVHKLYILHANNYKDPCMSDWDKF